jgi:hypothetical protein
MFKKRMTSKIFRHRRDEQETGKYCTMWRFMICSAHQILLGYQIKEDKISRACGIRHERCMQDSDW